MSLIGIKLKDVCINMDDVMKVVHFQRRHPHFYQDDPPFSVAKEELDHWGMMAYQINSFNRAVGFGMSPSSKLPKRIRDPIYYEITSD